MSDQSGSDDAREAVLRELRLPEKLAPLIAGETPDEMAASAREVADHLGLKPAPTEAVLLARKALAHAERYRQIIGDPDPEVDEEGDPEPASFDGGVRESVDPPSDPEEEHNSFVAELAAEVSRGRGGAG